MGLWAHGGVGLDDFGSVRLKLVPFNAEVIPEQISFGCLEFVLRKFWEILENIWIAYLKRRHSHFQIKIKMTGFEFDEVLCAAKVESDFFRAFPVTWSISSSQWHTHTNT